MTLNKKVTYCRWRNIISLSIYLSLSLSISLSPSLSLPLSGCLYLTLSLSLSLSVSFSLSHTHRKLVRIQDSLLMFNCTCNPSEKHNAVLTSVRCHNVSGTTQRRCYDVVIPTLLIAILLVDGKFEMAFSLRWIHREGIFGHFSLRRCWK